MAIEIVSFPIQHGGSFQFVMLARWPGRVIIMMDNHHFEPIFFGKHFFSEAIFRSSVYSV